MIKQKPFEGVIETVRYAADGKIEWVRAYERRGFVFTDHFLLDRAQLIERLKIGQRFFTGQRKHKMGNDFNLQHPVQLVQHNGDDFVVVEGTQQKQDHLAGIPIC